MSHLDHVAATPSAQPCVTAMHAVAPLMRLSNISKAFGAAPVLTRIDLDIFTGQTLGLIGPNGAGKTTLFNILSGFLHADSGTIEFDGQDIARLSAQSRAQAGVLRTFQKSLVFGSLSVRANVAMAARVISGTGYTWRGAGKASRDAQVRADALLEQADMQSRAQSLACDLSYGEQRILDVLMALAQTPRVLLLDEPTAGLSEQESARLLAIVGQHHAQTAVVLVSHDIDVVFATCERIAVLDLGVLIAVDTPQAIRDDVRVRAAYLGMATDDEEQRS